MSRKRLIIIIVAVLAVIGIGVGVGVYLESLKPQQVSGKDIQDSLDRTFTDVKYVEKITVTPYGTGGELEDENEKTGAANVDIVFNELTSKNMNDFVKRLPEISKAPIVYQIRANDYIVTGFTYANFKDTKTPLVESVEAVTTTEGIREAAIRYGSADGTKMDSISVLFVAPDPTDTEALNGFVKNLSRDNVDVNMVSRPNPAMPNSFTRIDVTPADGTSKLEDSIVFTQKLNELITGNAQITATVNAGTGLGTILYTSSDTLTEEQMEKFVKDNANTLTFELFNSASVAPIEEPEK